MELKTKEHGEFVEKLNAASSAGIHEAFLVIGLVLANNPDLKKTLLSIAKIRAIEISLLYPAEDSQCEALKRAHLLPLALLSNPDSIIEEADEISGRSTH